VLYQLERIVENASVCLDGEGFLSGDLREDFELGL
jgi:hypothetical protein